MDRVPPLDLDDMLGRHLRPGGGITTAAFPDLLLLVGRFGIHLPRWFGTFLVLRVIAGIV